jgi:hypothetical protein
MRNLVYDSFENDRRDRCVDLFKRADDTHGFEEYRRDPEDARWTAIGYYASRVFASREAALAAAIHAVPWLGENPPA